MKRAPFCVVPDCGVRHYCRGFCRPHYRAWAKYGDPLYVTPTGSWLVGKYKDDPERFWCRADQSGGPDSCWNWLGLMKPQGYGSVNWRGKKGTLAHRVAVELSGRTIPDRWDVDHLCFNKACVNPTHLEPVTHAENLRRSRVAREVS